jgi:hypothetical protein
LLHETVLFLAVLRIGRTILGNRFFIEFSRAFNGKRRSFERNIFSAGERCGNRWNWPWAAAGLLQRGQTRDMDIGAETDKYLPLEWSGTAKNVLIVHDFFIASIHRLATFSLSALGVRSCL